MKLACQEGMAPGKTLREKAETIAQLGYEGMEFWGSGLGARVKEITQALAGTGVKPSTICAGYQGCLLGADPKERQQAMADIEDLLSAGADLGVVGLIVVPVFGGPRLPDMSPWKTAVEAETELLVMLLDEMGQHAAKVGCTVLVEPLNRYETHFIRRLEQAVDCCKRVANERVGIMADFFHMSIEEADIAGSIRQAGEYVHHVHLADSNRLLPGHGHTDFASGFAALSEIGFANYMAMECSIPGDPKEELGKSARYLRQWM